ncbi:hypothetical protein LEP1GSC185_2338 [Leptospira licerasiae serovar Varillal str. VAR 010]|uniref:DUF1640 domain-containing protein n=1 Tax=Leptospira licerasiae str. MMD4847 TaxID=1049971 RepID=A0ABN0HD01_9LEPT|nr:hypothetical protein LEP1GSC185_2338 [Leptospira licerasiae serovar Varillal str. VAR 010]EJZ43708.1 hypothetical protein LEP1GSC178_0114 [Leptospira licerasiae str. MMD4847]
MLREVLGEDASESLLELTYNIHETGRKNMEEFLSQKFDLKLSEESKNLHNKITELKVEISDFRAELKSELWKAVANLNSSIVSQTRWMIACVFAVGGFYFTLAKIFF